MPGKFEQFTPSSSVGEQPEKAESLLVLPPVTTLLLEEAASPTLLAPEIKENPRFQQQARERREALASLEEIFQKIPNPTQEIEAAVEAGLLSKEEQESCYERLATLLESDEENARLILYVPFELLPTLSSRTESIAQTRFGEAYRQAWWKVLVRDEEVRANFNDGDIIQGTEMPRVHKAAHLLPRLVEKGIIQVEEVITFLETVDNPVLQESIGDGLAVLADLQLITAEEWRRLLTATKPSLQLQALETAHTLTGTVLTDEEVGRLFSQFQPEKYPGMNAQAFFEELTVRLERLAEVVESGVLGEKERDQAVNMVLAGLRFWSIQPSLLPVVLAITERNPESLLNYQATPSPSIDEWVRRWNRPFLVETGAEEGDGLTSAAVMSEEMVRQRVAVSQRKQEDTVRKGDVAGLIQQLNQLLAVKRYDQLSTQVHPAVKARLEWRQLDQREQVRQQYAECLAGWWEAGDITDATLQKLLASPQEEPQLLGVKALTTIVERGGEKGRERVEALCQLSATEMSQAYVHGAAAVRDALITAWSYAVEQGILPKETLENHQVDLPDVGDTSSIDISKRMKKEIAETQGVIEKIQADPFLKDKILPAVVLYGSRLKGYARGEADLDSALFVAPNTVWEERQSILQGLREQLASTLHQGKVVDFWLDREGERYRSREVPTPQDLGGNEQWMNILFQGVWCGQTEEVQHIYRDILQEYLLAGSQMGEAGYPKRAEWLEQMERDILQYRLMHKGYARYYPRRGGIQTLHSERVDGQSRFWDSGYRRVATRLFTGKVFLPEL